MPKNVFMDVRGDGIRSKISGLTPAHGAAGIRWLATQDTKGQLGLTAEEQRIVLGGIDSDRFSAWREEALAGNDVALPAEVMERLSLLISIYVSWKMLAPCPPNNDISVWFNRPIRIPPFNGLSMKQLLLADYSIDTLKIVSEYLLYLRWR